VSFGTSRYLLVTPKGGRLWQYRYRFQGREKLLSFGGYPDISMESARARGHTARQLLDLGVDPSERRKQLLRVSRETAGVRLAAMQFVRRMAQKTSPEGNRVPWDREPECARIHGKP